MNGIQKIKSNIDVNNKINFNVNSLVNNAVNTVVDVADLATDVVNMNEISINDKLLAAINNDDLSREISTVVSKYYDNVKDADLKRFLLTTNLDIGNYEEAINSVINYYKLIPNGKNMFEKEFGFALPTSEDDIEYSYLTLDFYLYYAKKVKSCDTFSSIKSFDLKSEEMNIVNNNFLDYINKKDLVCSIKTSEYNEEYLKEVMNQNKFITMNTDGGIVTLLEINDDGSFVIGQGMESYTVKATDINVKDFTVYDYLESITKNLNDSMPRYYQENYQNVPLGTSTVALGGCGFTAGAMIASYLTGKTITPVSIAEEFGNQYYIQDQGMSWEFPEALAESYNLGEVVFTNDTTQVIDALQKGEPAMCSQNVGLFTQGGHIIVLSGITNDGKILVHDPKYENSITNDYNNRVFDLETEIDSTAFCYWIFKGNS